jgi:phospholipid transport system substrate-binding protein
LQGTWEQIVVILKSARFDSKAEIDAFGANVMQVVSPRFDFAEMVKRCLGPHWENRTPEERQEFVTPFATTLARSYIDGIRSYENSTVLFTREWNNANSAEVDTKIVTNGAKDLVVSYKMHLIDDDWKVYDVIIDDISLVDNYRSQFHRVIMRSSFEDLLRILKEKGS